MLRTGFHLRLLLAAILVHALALTLPADTTESFWNATTSAWSTSTNWTTNTLPSSTVSAVFNTAFSNQPTLSAAVTAQGIWVTGSNPTGVAGLTLIDATAPQT